MSFGALHVAADFPMFCALLFVNQAMVSCGMLVCMHVCFIASVGMLWPGLQTQLSKICAEVKRMSQTRVDPILACVIESHEHVLMDIVV